MFNRNNKIVIIGAGPTGIGAAYRLRDLGYDNWIVYEKNNYVGGLSATHVDDKGFLWDEGIHVLYSDYPYFDAFINEVLANDYYEHQRDNWVKILQSWVPYPFQNNLRYLPLADQLRCMLGLIQAQKNDSEEGENFKDWIIKIFGEGIAELFMLPYNADIWATPLEKMSKDWIAKRVSIVNINKVLENLILQKDDVDFGVNKTFKFPKNGGTGEIYRRAAKLFGDKLQINKKITNINTFHKEIIFSDGDRTKYDYLVSAMPLNQLINIIENAPLHLINLAQELHYTSANIVGIGLNKKIPTTKCWVYFPEPQTPFYRLSYFHRYSPYNVPNADPENYSSLMCEVSYSKYKTIRTETLLNEVIDALIKHGIIDESDREKIVSQVIYNMPYSYPVATLDRNVILRSLQLWLAAHNIYSRGRFGAWRYETGDMHHSFMQGAEVIDYILNNKKETVWQL